MERRLVVTAAAEVRAAQNGQHLYGTLVTEGRAASGGLREVFTPGSVEWPAEGIGILTEHRAAPEMRVMPVREPDGRITVNSLATPAIRVAVRGGKKFMSVEFHSLQERTTKGGVREILRAFVPDVALVSDPEYDTTAAELRRRAGGFRTGLKAGKRMSCRCSGKGVSADVDTIEFPEGAFDNLLAEITGGKNLSAISRGAGDVVGDTATGSLKLSRAGDGGLDIGINPLDTQAGRGTRELVEAGVAVYARPVIDFGESTFEVVGNVAKVSIVASSYVLVKPTDRTSGLEPLMPAKEGREASPAPRRRRVWL